MNCRKSYEPKRSDLAVLLAVIGRRRFARLQKELGGRRLWIPKPGARLACMACVRRDECIYVWRKEGRKASEVASFLGLSPKTVFHVAARPRRESKRA